MRRGEDFPSGIEVRHRRPWGCIIGCVGEVLALILGFYYGAHLTAYKNPHNAVPGEAEVVAVLWAAAFGVGWPVVCLLGFAAWRVLAALDRRANRAEDENT